MPNICIILFWSSGLAFGLAICALLACPYWKVAVPLMLFISGAAVYAAQSKMKSED